MIIFGTRAKHKTLGEGQFFCPHCQSQRAYLHQQATRYFTLYFIPLIPMGKIGEFVQCQTCGTAFHMQVLTQKAASTARRSPADLAKQINAIPNRLRQGVPAEYLVRDLTAVGLDRDAALDLVKPHLGDAKSCNTCGLSYSGAVTRCTECGQALSG